MTVSSIQSSSSQLAYHAASLQQQAHSVQQQATAKNAVAVTDRETTAENRGIDTDDGRPAVRGATFSTYA